MSIERTVGRIVTAINSLYAGTLAMVVHLCLIHIARIHGISTKCATEDVVQTDSGTIRNINHCTARDTFLEAATIGCTNLTTRQINDSRSFIWQSIDIFVVTILMVNQKIRIYSHAKTTVGTSTKHFHILEFHNGLRYLYQHIAAILHKIHFDAL